MVYLKCIGKVRYKNGNILRYALLNQNNETIMIEPDDLKHEILAHNVEVINLTLTSDNRLIDKSITFNDNVDAVINKMKILGKCIEFNTECNHTVYVYKDNQENVIICIPKEVKMLTDKCTYASELFDKILYNMTGKLKVIGGAGLVSTAGMFYSCSASMIDLTSFNTANVQDMDSMFLHCKSKEIKFGNYNTKNVVNMHFMFGHSHTESLNLSSFDTHSVRDMSAMFAYSKAKYINLYTFKLNTIAEDGLMFIFCDIGEDTEVIISDDKLKKWLNYYRAVNTRKG